MSYQHAVVWVDHQHATVIDYSFDDQHVVEIEREGGQRKVHRRSGVPGPGKAPVDHQYYDEIAAALRGVREVLIVGPGAAKHELQHELQARHAAVAKSVVGVEAADHPSAGELLAFAKRYFKRIDALLGDA